MPLHLGNGRFRVKLAKTKIVLTSSICLSNFVVNILSRSKAALRSFTCTIGKVFVVSKSKLAKNLVTCLLLRSFSTMLVPMLVAAPTLLVAIPRVRKN